MKTMYRQEVMDEDRLVAELHLLGITYLSNRATDPLEQFLPPAQLLAKTICQPSSRVRTAVIAVFLLHPEYAEALPASFDLLKEEQRQTLKLFYTAAVYQQRLHQNDLLPIVGSNWAWLPDRYSQELGIAPDLAPQAAIRQLGIRHQELTHSFTNWAGTYENAVLHLIRYKQREAQWNPLQPKP